MLNKRPRSGSGSPAPKLFSGKVPMGQPAWSLLSPVDADAPWFDLDVPAGIAPGDKIEVQYGTSADFSGAISVITTLTTAQASHGVLDLAQTALTNGNTYYFRARYTIRGVTGPWSATRSYTVATAALPKVRSGGSGRYPSSSFDGIMVIAKDIDFGPPDASRFIIACIGGAFSAIKPTHDTTSRAWVITDKDIAAGTFSGTEIPQILTNTITGSQACLMFAGVAANGRSGRIVFNIGAGTNNGVGVASAYNLASTTPADTRTADRSFPGDPFPIGTSISVPSGGFVLAFAQGGTTGYAARAWQNGFTELNAANIKNNATAFSTMASLTSGAAIAALNRGAFQDTSGIAASWS